MAAAAILSTAAALWSGNVPDDPRPPEFAKIDEKVREWLPRPEERRFDDIGWARTLTDALPLAKESGRGIFVVAHVGHLNTGRTDGGSMSLRGGPLSDPRIIELLNTRFVPVYASTHNKADKELSRVSRESLKKGMGAGTEYLYFLDSNGVVIDSAHICTTTTATLLEKLTQHVTGTPGAPLTPPVPQAAAPSGERLLHVTSRYLDRKGQVEKGQTSYHAFPAEEWITLTPAEEAALVSNPAAPLNATWDVDLATSARLLSRVYPLTANMIDAEKNQLEGAGLTATVVGGRRDVAWIRIDGRVAMDHPFFAGRGEHREVESAVTGYIEYNRAEKRIRTLRLITDRARYGKENFAVAIRSVP